MWRIKNVFLSLIIFSAGFSGQAQIQTESQLTLKRTEELFQQNNLHLLAAHFEIDAARAQIIQARLWQNPYVYAEVNALNPDPENSRVFDAGRRGQKVLALEQLIHLGGKKKNEVSLARSNAELAELEFQDLLRNLRYELRVSYFSLYFDRLTAVSIEKQLENLDSLLKAYKEQAEKGNVPYRDIVRLQSLYLTLQNEKILLQNRILEEEKDLRVLLGIDGAISPAPTEAEVEGCRTSLTIPLDSLQAVAIKNRPDAASAEKQIESAQWNLKWQKSLAVPDISVGANYDQRGGAFNNQVNLTVGIPLPILNRNQGNIRMAEAYLDQSKVHKDLRYLEIKNQVKLAYDKYIQAYGNFLSIQSRMDENFEAVYKGVLQNFQRRNISILEFTDFMESYNSSLMQMNEIRKALRESCEEINLITMQNLF